MNPIRLLLIFVACALSLSSFGERKVLGKLGQALEATPIYSKTDTHAKVFYRCQQYEYVVVKETKYKAWTAVLLRNGRYGYIQTEKMTTLPYEVTSGTSMQANSSGRSMSLPSRGSFASSSAKAAVARYSLNYVGVPYKWGGTDLSNGVDCSGFMKQLFGKIGMSLPRTAAEQVNVGQRIQRLEDLQAGDRLYFWSYKRNKVGHTAIYLGNGYFCHASSNNGRIVTDYLGKKHWLAILVAARR